MPDEKRAPAEEEGWEAVSVDIEGEGEKRSVSAMTGWGEWRIAIARNAYLHRSSS